MGNYLIAIVLLALVAVSVSSTIKHFQGKSSCCGGGDYKIKRKKLEKILYQKTYIVEGIHCENCKKRIEETVNDISDVSGTVDFKKRELTVTFAKDVDDEIIKTKISKAGYKISA